MQCEETMSPWTGHTAHRCGCRRPGCRRPGCTKRDLTRTEDVYRTERAFHEVSAPTADVHHTDIWEFLQYRGGHVCEKTGILDGNYIKTTTSHLAPAQLMFGGTRCVEIAHDISNFARTCLASYALHLIEYIVWSTKVEPRYVVKLLMSLTQR